MRFEPLGVAALPGPARPELSFGPRCRYMPLGCIADCSCPSKENAMPTYKAPVADALFLLNDVFHIERFATLPGFADATPDVLAAMFGTAARFCEEVLTPLNRVGDEAGCRRDDDGGVATPPGFKDAY